MIKNFSERISAKVDSSDDGTGNPANTVIDFIENIKA